MAITQGQPLSSTRVRVQTDTPPGNKLDLIFDKSFRIGRADDCEVCIKDQYVSRYHAEVSCEAGEWQIRDLNSSNGIYLNGERQNTIAIAGDVTVRLGAQGPAVEFQIELSRAAAVQQEARAPSDNTMVAHYVEHYFGRAATDDAPIGEHTMFVRRAFAQVQAKQRRQHWIVIAILACCGLAAAGYAIYLHHQVSEEKATAKDLFYSMKALDVDIGSLEKVVMNSPVHQGAAEIQHYQNRRRALQKNYDNFLATLKVYDPKMTPQRRLILRVARIFGECELDMPKDFTTEVEKYIQIWKTSGRFERAIHKAQENGYVNSIASEFLNQDLPPQFFYLALQESDFDPFISGPVTRKGIAKGMWQFIPETAIKYGLHLGPLVDLRRPDPGDDRHHWDRETKAAARYIKDLYTTDAQASGLLVMACYNWGEDYVLPLVRSMPDNPRERNLWRFLARFKGKIPQETYDYVFYISSAAVIGEDPRLFGFNFDNPLKGLESK